MSSSTIFIALQCCQCSTMQVKQKKKSSNKWSCAVCNQKQSVRKVFAQGFIAKEIRNFVQNFNMSRKSLDDDDDDDSGEWLLAGTLDPVPELGEGKPGFPAKPTKKWTDWTAYLDPEDYHITKGGEQEQNGDDDFEPQVVTELQEGMFKKRRLVETSTRLGGGGCDKLSKRPHLTNSQGELIKDQGRTLTESNSEMNNYVTPDNQKIQKCKPTISRAASKWNEYVTEDNDNLEQGWKVDFKYHSSPWNKSVLEAITSDQSVEDDIHPDFL